MKKHLMATTAAITIAMSSLAYAQEGEKATENMPIFQTDRYEDMAPVEGFYAADPNQVLATRFIGSYIYTSAGEEAENIGDVNDIIMTPDGRAVAVIAGIGGFLGIGEKEVAVSMDQLTWTTGEDGEQYLVGNFSKEQLEAAPEFDRDSLRRTETAQIEQEQAGELEKSAEAAGTETEKTDDMAAAEQPAEQTEEMAVAPTAEEQADASDEMKTGAINRMETISAAEANLEATEIIGMSVIGADNERIGEVSEILIGENGEVEAFIVDVGGFLGINEKPVAVSFEDLQFARAEGDDNWAAIQTGLTAEALEQHQAYSEDQYKADKDTIILDGSVN